MEKTEQSIRDIKIAVDRFAPVGNKRSELGDMNAGLIEAIGDLIKFFLWQFVNIVVADHPSGDGGPTEFLRGLDLLFQIA